MILRLAKANSAALLLCCISLSPLAPALARGPAAKLVNQHSPFAHANANANTPALARLRAYAASQGRWVTADLPRVQLSPIQRFQPEKVRPDGNPCYEALPVTRPPGSRVAPNIVPTPCGGGGGDPTPPPGYVHITQTVSSYVPYLDPGEESTALEAGAPINKTKTDPGYDVRIDYTDGTSGLMLSLKTSDGKNNQAAIMHPDGTSTVVALNLAPNPAGATLSVVQQSVQTSTLGKFRCDGVCRGIITGIGAIGFGALAEYAVPEGGPWSFRVGAVGGAYIANVIIEYYTY